MEHLARERKEKEERFYKNLEESDTLIDYFCVIGLDQHRIAQMLDQKLSRE